MWIPLHVQDSTAFLASEKARKVQLLYFLMSLGIDSLKKEPSKEEEIPRPHNSYPE